MPDRKNLLIGVSGGIAAYKVCNVASYFTKMGVNVNVVMTEHGAAFVGPITFEALTKNPCLTSLFDGKSDDPVAHVNLGRSADCVLVAPATANVIAKLANGISDTPVLMAAKAHLRNSLPLVIAISSNDALGINFQNIGKLMVMKTYLFCTVRSGPL